MEGVIYLWDDTNASTQKPSDIYMAATHLMAAHIIFLTWLPKNVANEKLHSEWWVNPLKSSSHSTLGAAQPA